MESIPSKPGITKNDEAYLREVLRRWLDTPAPSIQDLIKALRDCYLEEVAKALESHFVFRTGQCMCGECACVCGVCAYGCVHV